jgi:oligoribonuclease (3'-5' exoribonuclease)
MGELMLGVVVLDLETSGLEDNASILEVGLICCNRKLQPLKGDKGEGKSWLVRPHRRLDLLDVHPDVLKMHANNDLWDDLASSELQSVEAVDAFVVAHLTHAYASDEKMLRGHLRLAGSGVSHFDARLLRLHLPRTFALFHHATLDAGVLRRAFQTADRDALVPIPAGGLRHRALDDAYDHHAELLTYLRMLKEIEL